MPEAPEHPTSNAPNAIDLIKMQIKSARETVERMPKSSQMNMCGRFVVEEMD